MIRITAFGIPGGEDREVVFEGESIQVTGDDVRDPDGNQLLHYFAPDMTWFDTKTGRGWYDWTVEAITL